MTSGSERPDDSAELRRRAEERAQEGAESMPEHLVALSPKEIRRMLHDLRVHQIELEMQNENLRGTQAALEASRARYFDLYDLAPVGYCTLSEKGVILDANLTAATMLNLPRSTLVKQPIVRFMFAEDQDTYYRYRKRLFATGEPQGCELRMVRADSAPIWVRLDATVVRDEAEGGAPVARMVLSDTSERRKSEEERDRLHDQLNQARKMEAVGRLAGGVAHDFNNMLSVIIGNAELVMERLGSGDPHHDALQEIVNAARHSAGVTRQLLTFARREAVAPKVICLNDAMEGMRRMIRRLIGADIELAWLPEGELWPVRMDPGQLDQILANLCVNARDAIGGVGKITIETRNARLDQGSGAEPTAVLAGDYVVLSVSDDGCGMDGQTQGRIFEPFFTTKGVDKGTGLGLATVYGIVKQNGGFIEVDSGPGRGTTFKVHFPRYETTVAAIRAKDDEATVAQGNETILVVEDEPAILRVSRMMLEQLGYTVLTAAGPGEATRLVDSHPGKIHLLLTDVIMPEMNGRDLARKLLGHDPSLRCLFMSGYPANIIGDEGLVEGGVNFVQKPFSIKELAAKVREALDKG